MFVKYLLCVLFYFTLIATQTTFSKAVFVCKPYFSNYQGVDSVNYWIKKSQENNLTKDIKLSYLRRAADLAYGTLTDSVQSQHFSSLSYYLMEQNDSLLFREVNKKAILLSTAAKDSTILASAYWDLGEYFDRKQIPDSAYYSYAYAQKIYEANRNFFQSGRMLYNMALQQRDIKDYIGSEATTIQAIERFKPLKKNAQLYKCYDNLGTALNAVGDNIRALEYHMQALSYLKKMDNPRDLIISNTNNLGIVNRDNGNYQEAIKKFNEVLAADNLKKAKPLLYAKALNNLAHCKIRIKDTVQLRSLIVESIKIKDSLKDLQSLASSYFTLAEYHLLKNDSVNTIYNAKKALDFANQSSNNQRVLETLGFLAQVDQDHAANYAGQYIALNDQLLKEERHARNKFARIRFETDEFIAENQELELQTESLSKEKKVWIAISIAFLLLALLIYIIIDQRARNQKLIFQQQQQANNQEIFNLMLAQKQKVDDVKRSEQKRISEELHDGVLGKMLGVRMVLTGLNKKNDPSSVQERMQAIAALQCVESEIRAISHELSHSAYKKINNFINSVKILLSSVEDNVDILTFLDYDEHEDWDSLSGEVKINVYRIIQETLQNAVKHSNCSNFFLKFGKTDDFLTVTMRDDGKGFEYVKGKSGIGMRNISSRTLKINGIWNINSVLGKGTCITIKIPTEILDNDTFTEATAQTLNL